MTTCRRSSHEGLLSVWWIEEVHKRRQLREPWRIVLHCLHRANC